MPADKMPSPSETPLDDTVRQNIMDRLDRIAAEMLLAIAEDPDKDAATRIKAFSQASDWLKERAKIKPVTAGGAEGMNVEAMKDMIKEAVRVEADKSKKNYRQNVQRAKVRAEASSRANGQDKSGDMPEDQSARLKEMLSQLS